MKQYRIKLCDYNDKLDDDQGILTCYIANTRNQDNIQISRPAMLILPGGAYKETNTKWIENYVSRLMSEGFNAFVLEYSVSPKTYPTQIMQVGAAIAHIRINYKKYSVLKDKIVVSGFSAGGHLAGNYSCQYEKVSELINIDVELLKIQACIMGYAVVSNQDHPHANSFINLTDNNEKLSNELSLEKLANENVCPTFIWHTATDELVPVQNSIVYGKALADLKVPFELHIFCDGGHGLGMCEYDEYCDDIIEIRTNRHVKQWINLCFNWLSKIEL